MKKTFLLIGGDNRLKFLYKSLKNKNFLVEHIYSERYENEKTAIEKINKADVIILPIPLSNDQRHILTPLCDKRILIEDIIKNARSDALIFGGGEHLLFQNNKNYVNLLLNEELTLKNAYATAEATLAIIEENSSSTIKGESFAVLGYGRIGKILCRLLTLLGGTVTVYARRPIVLEEASRDGYKVQSFNNLKEFLKYSTVIINTVPHPVLTEKEILTLKSETVIIDLASRPGGVDFISARKHGLCVVHALSLPGKFSPKSAAEYIEDTVLKQLET